MVHLLCKNTFEVTREDVGGFTLAFTNLQINFLPIFAHPQLVYLLTVDALKDCEDLRELEPPF